MGASPHPASPAIGAAGVPSSREDGRQGSAAASGPLPTPQPGPLQPGPLTDSSATREGALKLLLRRGEATAAELSDQLSVSVQVMRRHLRSLEEAGLVESTPAPEGPGRPSNRWRLTGKGRDRFPDGSENFALGLLHSLASSLPPETIRHLMDQQALEKATDYRVRIGLGSLEARLEQLVELRRNEGYVAELRLDGDAWVISEFHCSVMRIAEEFPMVCDQELQLIRHTFPDCQVERIHWRLEEGHSCGFRLTPRSDARPVPGPC
jgi:DeoR family suf operon transcriptional repressor